MKPANLHSYLTVTLRKLRLSLLILAASLAACSKEPAPQATTVDAQADPAALSAPANAKAEPLTADDGGGEYATIEWTDLIPKDDLDALLSPPEYLDDIEDGSEADQIDSQTQSLAAAGSDDRYQQALSSKRIIAEYNNQRIRMPGFIVPLEFDDNMAITEFFLVPYFGACIHLPPPPPNQVVHVTYKKGLQTDVLYDPFWISGTLKTRVVQTDIATAAYTLEAVAITTYDEPTPQ